MPDPRPLPGIAPVGEPPDPQRLPDIAPVGEPPESSPQAARRSRDLVVSPPGIAGQSSVQLVAIVPAFLLATLVALQLVLTGHALWSAGIAARAGARAAHVGGVPSEVALEALPASLRSNASVRGGRGGVRVRVEVPSLVPGLPRVPLVAQTALQPEGEGG